MSRLLSVAMTTDAVIERRKTVSRRANWWEDKNGRRLLHVGDTLTLCRKVQGRKPGEPIDRLAEVEVVDVRREQLVQLTQHADYGHAEVEREGFPGMSPGEFVRRFFVEAQGMTLLTTVTRIEWKYLDTPHLTIAASNAHTFANRDREGTADQLLNAGVTEAIRVIRSGRRNDDPWAVHDAAVTLSVAGQKAERVMGR